MRRLLIASCLAGCLAGCAGGDDGTPTGSTWDAVAGGAGYLTTDRALGGCENGATNGNCNHFDGKAFVYVSGGPTIAGLADGDYFFAVVEPGHQNTGFVDGAAGNLSDAVAGGTAGDVGSGDPLSNRTFRVAGHEVIASEGTHARGQNPLGRFVVGVAPFDDTLNVDHLYLFAVCPRPSDDGRGGLVYPRPNGCVFDTFQVSAPTPQPRHAQVSGGTYYDANVNGAWDPGEVGLAGWPIGYASGGANTVLTGADGRFSLQLAAGTYSFWERAPLTTPPFDDDARWLQTGNRVDQSAVTGGATASLLADQTYTARVFDGSTVSGLYFGNVCLGEGDGKSKGFWANKHGEALVTPADLAMLRALELRTETGAPFDPTTYAQFHDWLQSANARNMANMLSAQLAALELNVAHGFVPGTAVLWTDHDFLVVGDLRQAANASLGAYGYTPGGAAERAHQESLKDALEGANEGGTFVQPDAAHCPTPHF